MKQTLTTSDWQRLRDLRQRFLNDASENYWKERRDLELYDQVYAERIGWKWHAVLENLSLAGWQPHSKSIIDWGCGTGVASRTVAAWSGIQKVSLVDQSSLALTFTQQKLAEQKINATFFEKEKPCEPSTLMLISHVVSELTEKELFELANKAAAADEVIWVEPGSHELSRRLSSLREIFIQAGHHIIAPCVHQHPCPMLDSNDRLHFKLAATDAYPFTSPEKTEIPPFAESLVLQKDNALQRERAIQVNEYTDTVKEADGSQELSGLNVRDTLPRSHLLVSPCSLPPAVYPAAFQQPVLSTGMTKPCAAEGEFRKKSSHWCHFFAKPPIQIFQSAFWHEASRELGIDLRSLPYSYFASSRSWKPQWPTHAERLIGHPRALKGHCKVLCCSASGLQERTLQKRDQPALFRKIVKKEISGVFSWQLNDKKLQ